jgi:hypothetical protein
MTWFAQSANETVANNPHCLIFIAADFDFPSGHVRVWSGLGDLPILGNTFYGTGELGKVSVAPERAGLDAPRKTYQLSGVDPSLVPESEIDGCFGRSVTEYLGFLNTESRALVDTPEINWEGRMDNVRRIDGRQPIIEVNAEHRMVLLDLADGWRYTHEHQQRFYAGDKGFDQVTSLLSKEILWGGQRAIIGWTQSGRARRPVYGD